MKFWGWKGVVVGIIGLIVVFFMVVILLGMIY